MANDIHSAARRGNATEVLRFLERGVDVDALDRDGATPLHRAAQFNHVEVVKLLLENNAALDHRDSLGRTPLHLAATVGSPDSLRFLIDSGAAIDAVEERGETPLMYAVAHAEREAATLLMDRNAGLDIQDSSGQTALFHSMSLLSGPYSERLALVKALVAKGADLSLVDGDGGTVIDYALSLDRDPEVVALLQQAAGAPVTAGRWPMVGGAECVLCKRLRSWKPSKSHPDYIRPDVIEGWLGARLPGRVAYASGTMYRGNQLIPFSCFEEWHSELCAASAEGSDRGGKRGGKRGRRQ